MSNYLVTTFKDTQKYLWENELLCQLTSQAVMCTQVFPERYDTTRVIGNSHTGISVTEEALLAAAQRMVQKYARVAVLNCANAVNPGGGAAYGARGQEEDLCRCSNLYSCLMKPELYESFYGYNNSLSPYYSDRVIYAPNVTVFKTEKMELIYQDEWFQVDILSCPAPNLNGAVMPDYSKLEKLYRDRIHNILAVAEAHGVQALVLGAFGCDAFLNPPELVAKAFYDEIVYGDYKNTFREIVFAIKTDSPQSVHNQSIFRSVLSPWQQNPLYGKKVSVLGDSISTFWGSSPDEYPIFYNGDQCLRAAIYSVNDTWWMQLIRRLGGTLLVNNSCAGSCVAGNSTFSGNNDNRLYKLCNGYEMPDVILISLGLGDFEYGILPEAETYEVISNNTFYHYFKNSYQVMLWKLRQMYPGAEIYCATIKYGGYDGNTDFLYKNRRKGFPLREYNRIIRECANEYGCRTVDLADTVKYYETIDGVHPTAVGMSQLAEGWIKSMNDQENMFYLKKKEKNWDWRFGILCGLSAVLVVLIVILAELLRMV